MKLANWIYEGPAFWGVSRITASMKDAQLLVYGAVGDSYPVSELSLAYKLLDVPKIRTTQIGRRELSGGAGNKITECLDKIHTGYPEDFIMVAPTSAVSLLKEDISALIRNFAGRHNATVINSPVHPLHDFEYCAAEKTLLQLVREFIGQRTVRYERSSNPSVNIIGPTLLGFHAEEDLEQIKNLMLELGIEINAIIPFNARVDDFKKIPEAWFNLTTCPEISLATLKYLKKEFQQPYVPDVPVGIESTDKFIRDIGKLINRDFSTYAGGDNKIDLNGKYDMQILVFGDYTHAGGLAKFLSHETKVDLVAAGTFLTGWGGKFKEKINHNGCDILITDDADVVNETIKEYKPDVVFGTYNEWTVSKKLNIPAVMVSAPTDRFYRSRSNDSFAGYDGAHNFMKLLDSIP